MTHKLSVHTDYEDINALASGFVDRVESDTLILYGAERFETGVALEFSVLLADGGAALEGQGKVRASVDGGAERLAETRYDVILEDLGFEGRYSAIFERLLLQKQSSSTPPTGEAQQQREATPSRPPASEENGMRRESKRPSKRASMRPNAHSDVSLNGGRHKKNKERASIPPEAPHDIAPPPTALDEPAPFVLTHEESALSRPRFPRLERAVDSLIPKSEAQASGAFNYPDGLPPVDRPPLPGLVNSSVASGSPIQSPEHEDFDDFASKKD